MTTLARICAGLVLAALMTGSARADEASKRAKLHEMFRLAHIDRTISLTLAAQQKQLAKVMQQMIPGAKITPEQQADLDAFFAKLQGIIQQGMNWEKLEPQFTDVYASVYSEEEVDGLLSFYKSPVGQEMVAKQPEILERSQAITQALLAQMQPQIMQAVLTFAQEMKTKYPNATAPAK